MRRSTVAGVVALRHPGSDGFEGGDCGGVATTAAVQSTSRGQQRLFEGWSSLRVSRKRPQAGKHVLLRGMLAERTASVEIFGLPGVPTNFIRYFTRHFIHLYFTH